MPNNAEMFCSAKKNKYKDDITNFLNHKLCCQDLFSLPLCQSSVFFSHYLCLSPSCLSLYPLASSLSQSFPLVPLHLCSPHLLTSGLPTPLSVLPQCTFSPPHASYHSPCPLDFIMHFRDVIMHVYFNLQNVIYISLTILL